MRDVLFSRVDGLCVVFIESCENPTILGAKEKILRPIFVHFLFLQRILSFFIYGTRMFLLFSGICFFRLLQYLPLCGTVDGAKWGLRKGEVHRHL